MLEASRFSVEATHHPELRTYDIRRTGVPFYPPRSASSLPRSITTRSISDAERLAIVAATEGATRRFARTRVYDPPLSGYATRHYGVCVSCLASDDPPRLRKHWTLGWVVTCERHGQLLTTTCERCWGGFILPKLKVPADRFDVRRCTCCFEPLGGQRAHAAHPLAMRLQSALLAGRDADILHWPGLPALAWAAGIALIDVLLAIPLHSDQERRRRCFEQIENERRLNGTCHDGMILPSWLLSDWPARASRLCEELKGESLENRVLKRKSLPAGIRAQLLDFLNNPSGVRP